MPGTPGRSSAQISTPQARPATKRLLIIHADDLGLAHSVNLPTFWALECGMISSASVMVPCPWFGEVVDFARQHPAFDIGIHLTLTSEWKYYRWRPIAPPGSVPSLIDRDGYFWADTKSLVEHARVQDVEREIRAQIDTALNVGIKLTHLDTHMFVLWQTRDLFSVFQKLAHEYLLPFLAPKGMISWPGRSVAINGSDFVFERVLGATARTKSNEWEKFYLQMLRSVPPGLSQLIVHLGYDNAELKAITEGYDEWGSAWRQRDFEVLTGSVFKAAVREESLRVVSWKQLAAQADLNPAS